MIQSNNHKESLSVLLAYFVFSILLNSFGNALTVSLNLGSALWTASAVNLSHMLNISLFMTLMVYGVIVVITNAAMLHTLDWRRMLGNLIFMFPFSYFVDLFSSQLVQLGITSLPLPLRIVLDLLGVVCIATAISIYQRVNLVLHPNDDLMQIIRFKFFNGNSAIAMWVSFIPPIIISAICILVTHRIFAINIGTLFALLFQGSLIGLADKIIFPSLKHRNLKMGK